MSGSRTKFCRRCSQTRPVEHFPIRRWETAKGEPRVGRQARCRECLKAIRLHERLTSDAYQRRLHDPVNRQHRKRALFQNHLMRTYGITLEDWARMLESQQGRCAICERDIRDATLSDVNVDHCHESGKVRGLLCLNCNMAIGLLLDRPETLRRATSYLESHSARPDA